MGDAQIRRDERLEADSVERGAKLAQRAAHKAQVGTADDIRSLPGQRFEGAMPKLDRLARPGRSLRRESRVVEQFDQAVERLVLGRRRNTIGSHRPTPALAGRHRRCGRPWPADERIREDLGELTVGAGVRIVGSGPGHVPQPGPSATHRRCDAPNDEPRVDELVQLVAHGVRVEADRLGKLTHADWTVRLAEDGEESRAGQPGEDAVAALLRCHGLHFARS